MRCSSTLLRRSALAAALAAGACSLAPLQPDLAAKAPALDGFGRLDNTLLTTTSDAARRAFRAGVLQAYAFNEKEAMRQFKAALAADPSCAMCAWGVAWQLGPNINAQQRGDLRDARQYVAHALKHTANTTPRERALIEAMALRYGEATRADDDVKARGPGTGDVCRSGSGTSGATPKPPLDPLDAAYADRLHTLVLAYPDDADILSLWAEAAMIATQDDWWDESTGKPMPRIGELTDRLERLLPRHPDHTGLNHYMIHAADALPAAPRALAAAERLAALAPNAPHLVHMPSHIYVRVGRFDDAARANERAVAADDALERAQREQGFDPSKDWRGHNTHFLWYAQLMQGRGDAALAAARALAQRADKRDDIFAEYARSLPLLTLLRLERWDAVLAENLPPGRHGLGQALAEHARATAFARTQRLVHAREALALAEAGAEQVRKAHGGKNDSDEFLRQLAGGALARVRAEVALAERRGDEALVQQALAVEASKQLDAAEPPRMAAGARLALAHMQLSLGRAVEAEATYRADLALQPQSGWALHGLARALAAQGKAAEAAAMQERAAKAWPQADAALAARS